MSDHNVYYSPEAYGLRTIGEVEFSSGSYEFDTFVLWQDVERKSAFFYAQDSGCSCPVPFDGEDRSTIKPINTLGDLIAALDAAKAESYRYDYDDAKAGIDAECAALVQKFREARQ